MSYIVKKQQWKDKPKTNKNGFLKREVESRRKGQKSKLYLSMQLVW